MNTFIENLWQIILLLGEGKNFKYSFRRKYLKAKVNVETNEFLGGLKFLSGSNLILKLTDLVYCLDIVINYKYLSYKKNIQIDICVSKKNRKYSDNINRPLTQHVKSQLDNSLNKFIWIKRLLKYPEWNDILDIVKLELL